MLLELFCCSEKLIGIKQQCVGIGYMLLIVQPVDPDLQVSC